MPLRWAIEGGPRPVVRVVPEGDYTYAEWRTMMTDILADPRFRPNTPFLIDRRHSQPPTTELVRSLVEFLQARAAEIGAVRCAIVVRSDDPASYGMVRMFGALTDLKTTFSTRVFVSVEEAERWLQDS
jgi:hypothetical protein